MNGQLAHGRRKAANLVGGLTLGSHAREQGTRQRRRQLTFSEFHHQVICLLLAKRLAVEEAIQ